MEKRFMIKHKVHGAFYAILGFLLIFCGSCRKSEPEVAPAPDASVETAAVPVESAVVPAVLEVAGGNVRDLGVISEHDVIPLEFTLRNAGKTVQTILDVSFSCPCGEILNPPNNELLQPDGTYTLKLNLFGNRISVGDFSRFLLFELIDGHNIGITIRGHIQANLEVTPGRVINLGLLTDSGEAWEKALQIRGVNQLASGFRLSRDLKSDLFELQLEELSQGSYTLKVRPKQSLPYMRLFRSQILLPILEPPGLPALSISIVGQIGEDIIFHPASFSVQESDYAESETLIRTASFGVVPMAEVSAQKQTQGTAPHKADRRRLTWLLFQPSSQKTITTIAWGPLFEHLEFDCPAGVRVEKELHENGISLKLYIDRSAFAENQQISIVPRRDENKFSPIVLALQQSKSADQQNVPSDHRDQD